MNLVLASTWEDESEEWLIPNLVCDSLTLLSGEPKSGKTALACHLIRSLISKSEILGYAPTQKVIRVAWMGFDFKWRREVLQRVPDLLESIYFPNTIEYTAEDEWRELGRQMLEKEINFLVIDHLYGLSAGADLDRQNQIQAVYAPIMELIESTGVAVLLLTQGSKQGGGRAAHSVASEGLARWLLRLSGTDNTKSLAALGNNAETKKIKLKLTPTKIHLKESSSKSEVSSSETPDGGLPERARYILENAPLEAKVGVKALGLWLNLQNKGYKNAESARSSINNLIRGGLLARDGQRGKIVRGPNLVT